MRNGQFVQHTVISIVRLSSNVASRVVLTRPRYTLISLALRPLGLGRDRVSGNRSYIELMIICPASGCGYFTGTISGASAHPTTAHGSSKGKGLKIDCPTRTKEATCLSALSARLKTRQGNTALPSCGSREFVSGTHARCKNLASPNVAQQQLSSQHSGHREAQRRNPPSPKIINHP